MKGLLSYWMKLNERYAALSRRERMLLAAALVIAPLMLGESLILDPQRAKTKLAERKVAQQSSSVAELRTQVASLQQRLQNNPDVASKAELARLMAEQQQLDDELRRLGASLVRPEEMNGLLEGLLARHTGLRLLGLKTLVPRSILTEKSGALGKEAENKVAENKSAGRKFDLYRHGVEIRLEGNYAELQAYLEQLERLKQRLLWGQLQYKVIEYPRAEMTIMVYTLSPDQAWLAL